MSLLSLLSQPPLLPYTAECLPIDLFSHWIFSLLSLWSELLPVSPMSLLPLLHCYLMGDCLLAGAFIPGLLCAGGNWLNLHHHGAMQGDQDLKKKTLMPLHYIHVGICHSATGCDISDFSSVIIRKSRQIRDRPIDWLKLQCNILFYYYC